MARVARLPARLARRTAPLLVVALGLSAPAAAEPALWARLAGGGQVVLLRHAATTPGVGDPAGLRLDDCATQRNLSEAGRAEARRLGATFRARAVPVGRVLSSPWCRCLETARLAFGAAEVWEPLRSLFADRSGEAAQTRAFRTLAGTRPAGGNTILVTHGANVLAFVGVSPAPAEMVIVTPHGDGTFAVAGRLPVP
jgi:broad specificity phosphatase PhoE